MPRSGSTLQYNLVRGIVEELGVGKGEGFYNPQEVSDMYPTLRLWASENDFHVIKTQTLFPEATNLLHDSNAKICYTYRDLRDVAASLERRFKTEGKDLYKILDDIIEEYHNIQKLPGLISIQYEEMIRDLEKATVFFAEALSLRPEPKNIRRVVDEFSLESARMKIKKFETRFKIEDLLRKTFNNCGLTSLLRTISKKIGINYTPPFFDPQTLMHAGHIAPANSQREDFLSEEQINYITERYRTWLTKYGYVKCK